MKEYDYIIIGLGQTGLSVARYLRRKGCTFALIDSRANPPGLDELRSTYPHVPYSVGGLDEALIKSGKALIVSPGVALQEPAIAAAIAKGTPAIGDVELFCREVTSPIIAITGSNGKTTVTSLVGDMAINAGIKCQVGGNIGTPVLDLLAQPAADLYVLELSSFQLESIHSLRAAVAVNLNISPDHMDRYETLNDYIAAKLRIYRGCQRAVFNRDDAKSQPQHITDGISFGLDEPGYNEFGIRYQDQTPYLAFGEKRLLPVTQLKIKGRHNWANALAALALGHGFGLPLQAMVETLTQYTGLPHRCQWVAEHNGVVWYNDSKGTNVGATVAALVGIGSELAGKIILLAGGQGKGQDFSPLSQPVKQYAKHVIVYGEDAQLLANAMDNDVIVEHVVDLAEGINQAKAQAKAGDAVLLAPACASFDSYNNYMERGEHFMALVSQGS